MITFDEDVLHKPHHLKMNLASAFKASLVAVFHRSRMTSSAVTASRSTRAHASPTKAKASAGGGDSDSDGDGPSRQPLIKVSFVAFQKQFLRFTSQHFLARSSKTIPVDFIFYACNSFDFSSTSYNVPTFAWLLRLRDLCLFAFSTTIFIQVRHLVEPCVRSIGVSGGHHA